jgi:glutathione peroxidase
MNVRNIRTIGVTAAAACLSALVGCSATDGDGEQAAQNSAQEAAMNDAAASNAAANNAAPRSDTEQASERYVLGYVMDSITGEPVDLADYRGRVVLIVNTASRCGLTPQYAGLQRLYEDKAGDGLVVLGFPANNFMGQEPGTNEQIAEFCEQNYGVTFPMFAKVSVKDDDAHPLFARLTELSEEPTWNFTKYLINREGELVERFGPRTAPEDAALLAKIDELLSEG